MANLQRIWERLAGDVEASSSVSSKGGGGGEGRRHFIDAAQEVAELSLPALRPDGTPIETQPYSSLPGKALRGLASRLSRTLFPALTQWYDYQLGSTIDAGISALDAQDESEVRAAIKDLFAERRGLVNSFIAARKIKAKLNSFIRRLLVEGQGGIQVLRDRVRTFPLRQIVVKRHSGELDFWVIKERQKQTAQEFDDNPADSFVYTLIDETNQEVHQQIDDGKPEDQKGKDGGDVRQYILTVSEFPDIEDYVHGFAWHFKGLMNEVDNMAASLGEATANAAWAVLLISPVANVTPDEVKAKWHPGSAAIANSEHFSWLTSGVKLNEWSFVGAVLRDLRQDLREIFLDEEPTQESDVTATAVLRKIERIDAQTSDLLVALETTLQQPLVIGVEVAIGLGDIRTEGVEGPIEVAITTGTSALQQDQRSMRALQKIGLAAAVDPLLRVDGQKLLREIGRGDGFNYEQVISRVDPAALAQQNSEPGSPGVPGSVPGDVQETAGGPQPTLESGAEDARREQRSPPVAA